MNTASKIGLAALGLGLVAYLGKRASDAKALKQGVAYRITKWGKPSLSKGILKVPLTLQITNPTTSTFTADAADITLFFWQVDQFKRAGSARITDIVLKPGQNEKGFVATLDLNALGKNVLNTLATVLVNRAFTLRADLQVTVNSLRLPLQSFIQEVNV